MKKISLWSKNHKWSARIIIIASFILLTILGIVTGSLLNDIGFSFSAIAILLFISLYLIGFTAYPSKSLKGKKLSAAAFYARQKSCDYLLAASTFCMIVYFSNQPGQLFNYPGSLHAAVPAGTTVPKDSTVKSYKTIAAFASSLKDETGKSLKWKEKKKLLKEQLRAIKKSEEISKGGKVALIILSVIVAIGLLGLVLSLACDISCNGSEGAAILVGIGGTALVIFLLVITLRAISGKKKKPKPDIKPESNQDVQKN